MTPVKPCSHECEDVPKCLGVSGVSYFTKSKLLHFTATLIGCSWARAGVLCSHSFWRYSFLLPQQKSRMLTKTPRGFDFVPEAFFPGLLKAHTLRIFLPSSFPKQSSLVPQHLHQSWSSDVPQQLLQTNSHCLAFLAHCSWGNLFFSSSQSIVHIPEIISSHLSPRALRW